MDANNPFLDWMNRLKVPDFNEVGWFESVDSLRQSFFKATRAVERDVPDMTEISNLVVEGAAGPIKARLYVPRAAGIAPAPAIVFFHGGGFVLGNLDSHDVICRRLADSARCRVLAIDYRLAPEHKFPAAHEDAFASWQWITDHADILGFDPDRLAVAGDSAGGNLAAFLCQETKRKGITMPAFQLLCYPLVQFADMRDNKLSFQEGGFFISPAMFDYFRDSYIDTPEERMDTRVSPLFAESEDFHALPPAHVVLCGWDPLRHEGQAYIDKLAAHGVPVTLRQHPGMVHGFMNLTGISVPARDAIHEAGRVVGHALGSPVST
ncbi:MAG: alpha/beta hydrolase [Pseudomonadota bacterium]